MLLLINYIGKLLNLKGISSISFSKDGIIVSLPKKPHICPCCQQKTNKVHDYRSQKIKHLFKTEHPISIIIRKRRYVCPHCSKRFLEDIPFLGKYQRMTTSFKKSIISQLFEIKSAKAIAKEHNISVTTVLRMLDSLSTPKMELPEIISIDEFKGNAGGEKFQFAINDPINKKVLDILPSRKANYLYYYFGKLSYAQRNNVKYVIMDMSKSFREVVNICFPNAKIIADKFHVYRHIQWAMENVRKEVQKNFGKERRIFFKKSRWILLKRGRNLKLDEREQLEVMLSKSEKLREAYELKEQFFELMEKMTDKKAAIAKWIKLTLAYNLKQFNKVTEMIYRWYNPIKAGLETGLTNGFTEGMNNKIKVLKRVSFGVKRFDRFRKRILYVGAKN